MSVDDVGEDYEKYWEHFEDNIRVFIFIEAQEKALAEVWD